MRNLFYQCFFCHCLFLSNSSMLFLSWKRIVYKKKDECYIEWKRMTTSVREWQLVVQRMKTNKRKYNRNIFKSFKMKQKVNVVSQEFYSIFYSIYNYYIFRNIANLKIRKLITYIFNIIFCVSIMQAFLHFFYYQFCGTY